MTSRGRLIALLYGGPGPDAGLPHSPPTLEDLACIACHIHPVLDKLGICVQTNGTSHGSVNATDGSGIPAPAPVPAGGGGGGGSSSVHRSLAAENIVRRHETLIDIKEEEDRIEHIRAGFYTTAKGREIHDTVHFLKREVAYLVNKVRPVTVAWQRMKGPAFIAHVLNHIREGKEKIPRSIDGIDMESLLVKMGSLLHKYGSNPLKAALDKYSTELLLMVASGDTIDDYIQYLQIHEK